MKYGDYVEKNRINVKGQNNLDNTFQKPFIIKNVYFFKLSVGKRKKSLDSYYPNTVNILSVLFSCQCFRFVITVHAIKYYIYFNHIIFFFNFDAD